MLNTPSFATEENLPPKERGTKSVGYCDFFRAHLSSARQRNNNNPRFADSCFTKVPNFEEVKSDPNYKEDSISLFSLYSQYYSPDVWNPLRDKNPKFPLETLDGAIPDFEGTYYRVTTKEGIESLREMHLQCYGQYVVCSSDKNSKPSAFLDIKLCLE